MNTIQEQLTRIEVAKNSGNYPEAEELCRQILAQELKPEEKASALLYLSQSLWRRGLVKDALPYAQEALSIAEEVGNKELQAKAIGNIGSVYHYLSDYPRALEYYHQALAINEELGNKRSMARNFGNIGIVYRNLSDYPHALEYYHQALAIFEELANKSGASKALGNIGIVYYQLSDYPRALEYYHQALAMDEELGDKSGVATNLGNIGIVYRELSDYSRALEYYHQALAMDEELANKSGIARHLSNIGSLYAKSDFEDYHRALEYFNQALAINEELGNKIGVAINLGNIGSLYAKPDFFDYNPAKAEEYLLQSLAISQELGTKRHLYEVYKSLADLYKQQARWQEHAEYLQLYFDVREEVQSEEAKKKADQMDYERKEAEREKQRAVELAQAEIMEKLLYRTFPTPIVPRLKKGEELVVEHFPFISVLFADLVGFTKLSLSIKPEIMIEMLNFIFTKFDTIIKQAGGHRLRTIGDGYFAICGAPDIVENHQYKLAIAALAMQKDVILPEHIQQELPEGTILDIRIGLHCGEAVCGMVGGLEKWQYDAYGDTINTASRMESHGEAGKIHISEDFKHALAEYTEFTFTPREPMSIKGKGMMNTYFLQ